MSDHRADSDCTVDPQTNLCTGCGVEHGDPCPGCTGRGYHAANCPHVETSANAHKETIRQ